MRVKWENFLRNCALSSFDEWTDFTSFCGSSRHCAACSHFAKQVLESKNWYECCAKLSAHSFNAAVQPMNMIVVLCSFFFVSALNWIEISFACHRELNEVFRRPSTIFTLQSCYFFFFFFSLLLLYEHIANAFHFLRIALGTLKMQKNKTAKHENSIKIETSPKSGETGSLTIMSSSNRQCYVWIESSTHS